MRSGMRKAWIIGEPVISRTAPCGYSDPNNSPSSRDRRMLPRPNVSCEYRRILGLACGARDGAFLSRRATATADTADVGVFIWSCSDRSTEGQIVEQNSCRGEC